MFNQEALYTNPLDPSKARALTSQHASLDGLGGQELPELKCLQPLCPWPQPLAGCTGIKHLLLSASGEYYPQLLQRKKERVSQHHGPSLELWKVSFW